MDPNDTSVQAATLLSGVADACERLGAFRHALQSLPDVVRVDHEFDYFGNSDDFPTAPKGVISWWVESNYRDGSSRCFTLDLFHDGRQWVIDAGITTPGRDGPDPLVVLPERNATTIPDCVRELSAAIDALCVIDPNQTPRDSV